MVSPGNECQPNGDITGCSVKLGKLLSLTPDHFANVLS